MVFPGRVRKWKMSLDNKLQGPTGTSLRSLVRGFLLTHGTEGHSAHTVNYYKGTLGRFLWYAERATWPDDGRLLTEWQVREFLAYVASETERWGGNSTSSRKKAASRTLHHYYRSLVTFFNWAIREAFSLRALCQI